jgi:iron complex outermembrane receptor protein
VPGPAYRNLDSRQKALFFSDRLQFSERWQADRRRPPGAAERAGLRRRWFATRTTRNLFLPQLALILPAEHVA